MAETSEATTRLEMPIVEAANKLAMARSEFESADVAYQRASRDRTTATNRLNEAQKAFDAVVAEMRKDAPRDSDWKRQTGVPA